MWTVGAVAYNSRKASVRDHCRQLEHDVAGRNRSLWFFLTLRSVEPWSGLPSFAALGFLGPLESAGAQIAVDVLHAFDGDATDAVGF